MRIFVAVRHSNDPAAFYGGLWSSNFYPALRALGHEIVESQVDLAPASRFMGVARDFTAEERAVRGRLTEQILEEVRTAHLQSPIDLFLSYFYNSHFDPAGFDDLRRLGIPSVNYYCNSIYQFELVDEIARKSDFSWHAERDARSAYLAVGAKPVWVQMAADPTIYKPIDGIVRSARAFFVGQRYADRGQLMASLIKGGVPIDIYGAGWGAAPPTRQAPSNDDIYLGRRRPKQGTWTSYAAVVGDTLKQQGPVGGTVRVINQWRYRTRSRALTPLFAPHARGFVTFADLVRLFSSYELCISFSNVWADGRPGSKLIPHVRLRDFEGPMSRACYLTGHSEELAEFYDIGREIDTYRSEEELTEKAHFYLRRPASAERLREAGHQRARRDHTWERRFQQLFSEVGLRPCN